MSQTRWLDRLKAFTKAESKRRTSWLELNLTIGDEVIAVREIYSPDLTLELQAGALSARLLSLLVDRELMEE